VNRWLNRLSPSPRSSVTEALLAAAHRADARSRGPDPIVVESGSLPERLLENLRIGLRKRIHQRIPADWLFLRLSNPPDETMLASVGPIQIKQLPPACVAQTCAKGELDAARGTALKRLVRYVTGENYSGIPVAVMRPVVQQEQAPGRWLIRVGLPEVSSVLAAPTPCTRKIKINSGEAEVVAVARVAGRPTQRALTAGEAAIVAALAGTKWTVTGAPMIRLYAPCSILPFRGSFEVAVPIRSH